MKEIKYRLFGKEHQIMYSWEEILNSDSLKDTLEHGGTEDRYYSPLMQYTGLKDNEDKEIYEKDVCEIWMGCKQDGYYVVEDLRELYLDMNHADSYYRITRIEVIGNIYENPELLEESK